MHEEISSNIVWISKGRYGSACFPACLVVPEKPIYAKVLQDGERSDSESAKEWIFDKCFSLIFRYCLHQKHEQNQTCKENISMILFMTSNEPKCIYCCSKKHTRKKRYPKKPHNIFPIFFHHIFHICSIADIRLDEYKNQKYPKKYDFLSFKRGTFSYNQSEKWKNMRKIQRQWEKENS